MGEGDFKIGQTSFLLGFISNNHLSGHFLGLGLIYVKMPKYFRNENILRAKSRKSEDI